MTNAQLIQTDLETLISQRLTQDGDLRKKMAMACLKLEGEGDDNLLTGQKLIMDAIHAYLSSYLTGDVEHPSVPEPNLRWYEKIAREQVKLGTHPAMYVGLDMSEINLVQQATAIASITSIRFQCQIRLNSFMPTLNQGDTVPATFRRWVDLVIGIAEEVNILPTQVMKRKELRDTLTRRFFESPDQYRQHLQFTLIDVGNEENIARIDEDVLEEVATNGLVLTIAQEARSQMARVSMGTFKLLHDQLSVLGPDWIDQEVERVFA